MMLLKRDACYRDKSRAGGAACRQGSQRVKVGFTALLRHFNSVVPSATAPSSGAYPDVRLQLEEGNTTQLPMN